MPRSGPVAGGAIQDRGCPEDQHWAAPVNAAGGFLAVDLLRAGQVVWASTEGIVLRPKDSLPPEYPYCLARSDGFREYAIQSMTGPSGRQRVQAEALSHFRVVSAPEEMPAQFRALIRPRFSRVKVNMEESRALAALRVALLLSGEVRVNRAEQITEAIS